jgi:predicted nucleic acid-binding protein
MAVLLLDTDVFSYMCARDSRRVSPYLPHLAGHRLALFFVTVGEQYAGYRKQVLKGTWTTAHIARLEAVLQTVLMIPYDIQVCRTYGDLRSTLTLARRTVAPNDLWIAACAVRHSLPLVTNNRKHFASISGLSIISEAPRPAR